MLYKTGPVDSIICILVPCVSGRTTPRPHFIDMSYLLYAMQHDVPWYRALSPKLVGYGTSMITTT